jgi:hypothetical protein
MYKKQYHFIFSLLPIIIGGFLYICFRSEDILFFSWMRLFNINYNLLRHINIEHTIITQYVIYSFPNGLWVLSGLFLLKSAVKNNRKILLLYSILFIAISIFIEAGQYFGILSGTFDILDLITVIVFSSIGLLIILWRIK